MTTQHVQRVKPMHFCCRACQTAWLDTLVWTRSTRQTCRDVTWQACGIWALPTFLASKHHCPPLVPRWIWWGNVCENLQKVCTRQFKHWDRIRNLLSQVKCPNHRSQVLAYSCIILTVRPDSAWEKYSPTAPSHKIPHNAWPNATNFCKNWRDKHNVGDKHVSQLYTVANGVTFWKRWLISTLQWRNVTLHHNTFSWNFSLFAKRHATSRHGEIFDW